MNDWERLQLLNSRKEAQREKMKQIRDAIPREKREEESQALFRIVTQTELYENAKWILSYVSFGSEVGTRELLKKALKDGKRVYVPAVQRMPSRISSADNVKDKSGLKMNFFRLENPEELHPGTMGIPEPEADPARAFPYDLHMSLDKAEECVFLVPGLAFDRSCHRLGYGGGCYDRYLSRFDKKMTVGLSFTEQIVDEVPYGDKDVALDLVVTPGGAFY